MSRPRLPVVGLIVLIRTFLSVSLEVEIDGQLPWRRSAATGVTGIGVFARAWTWLAGTVSLFVLAGLIRRSWHVLSPQPERVSAG